MGRAAKAYILAVIGAGALVPAYALANLPPSLYTALAALASAVSFRLPRADGTFSLSFLFLLYGIAHFSLAETLIAPELCTQRASREVVPFG